MENFTYEYSNEEPDYELIGGEKFFMAAAAPFVNHISTVTRLASVFTNYIDEKNIFARVLFDVDVYLSDEDHFRSDLSIICDFEKIKDGKRIYGAPDLIVEVLSESTMNNDIGQKKKCLRKIWSERILDCRSE